MAKLYPPYIEGTIPAFYGDSLTIPYSMNKVVHRNEIAGFSIKIKTIQNNLHLGTIESYLFDLDKNIVTFHLNEELSKKLNIGQYYKVQLAYIDKNNLIGYYSTVGVIKKTTQPNIYIQSLEDGKRNQALNSYIGCYEQEDFTEKVYSYNFKIWDLNNKIIIDSGELLHLNENDESQNKSIDIFTMTQELIQNSTYYIQYTVTTISGIVLSKKYRLISKQSVLPELSAKLLVSLNKENGYIDISLQGEKLKDGYEKTANGSFLLTRRKVNEPGNWEELLRFGLWSKKPSSWKWKDFTIEQGVNYIYSIQQYSDDLYSQRIESKEIYSDFEHAFLFDGERQLKIKYNPKISSFKTTILESKIETLGSKHPFIFRNGHVCYKDFPISGLISYLSDEENLFLNDKDFIFTKNVYRKSTKSDNSYYENIKTSTTNLLGDNHSRERKFKLEVLDWLNNGKPKLFRSPSEGNYIVRLMNISLSPMDQLGRLIHNFNCNAYEIDEYNYKNLTDYGFIKSEETKLEDIKVTYWATIESFNSLPKEPIAEYTDNILPSGIQANELNIQGMLPGDKIQIIYSDGNELDIIIGATGSYSVTNIAPISAIKLWGLNAKVKGTITYSYETTYSNIFGLYNNATIIEFPAKQIFGTDVVNRNIRTYIEDLKSSVINVYYMNFEKRPIQLIYADSEKDVIINNNIINIDNSNLYYDKSKTKKLSFNDLDDYLIYQVYLLDSLNNFYFDGKNKEKFNENDENNLTKIYIDPNIDLTKDIENQLKNCNGIDLNEIENYKIEDLKPQQLFIGKGVIATIGYCISFVTYNFETNDRYESKKLKEIYDKSVIDYENAILNYSGTKDDLILIENTKNTMNDSYKNLLNQIEKDLISYKKENGLGDDE